MNSFIRGSILIMWPWQKELDWWYLIKNLEILTWVLAFKCKYRYCQAIVDFEVKVKYINEYVRSLQEMHGRIAFSRSDCDPQGQADKSGFLPKSVKWSTIKSFRCNRLYWLLARNLGIAWQTKKQSRVSLNRDGDVSRPEVHVLSNNNSFCSKWYGVI